MSKYRKIKFIIIFFFVDCISLKMGWVGIPWVQGGRWRSLARALIAFHLATAHEQNTRENEEKNHYTNIF